VVKSPNFYDLNMNGMSMVYEYQNFMLEKIWKLDQKCGNEQISGPNVYADRKSRKRLWKFVQIFFIIMSASNYQPPITFIMTLFDPYK
jgi:hypothetical protein